MGRHLSQAPAPREREGCLSAALSWVGVLLAAVLCALLLRTFVVEPFVVPTGSMLETIQLGDRLLGEKVTYRLRDPEPGDVVTFEDPADPGTVLIKRVVAVEGQTVEMRGGVVLVDGEPLDEPYVTSASAPLDAWCAETLDGPVTYPYVVPEGCVWVMGDNRANSLDSRYFGAISIDSITSRAWLVYWPVADAGLL